MKTSQSTSEKSRRAFASPTHRRLVRPRVLLPVGIVAVVLLAVAAFVFQPWKLWVDDVVAEPLPGAFAAAPDPGADGGDDRAKPFRVVATGQLISHEHATSGKVRILRLPDGSRLLRLDDLDTSNGPALEVWITDAPVLEGRDGWQVFDDGRYVSLGTLKGNVGSQNYPIPDSVDLTAFQSVSIWCDRFNVSFGAAELDLRPTAGM